MCPSSFVEMLLLQNKPWLVRYKKIRAMSFLPSVECGKFKLKKAFQSGKILACSKKSEICVTSALKLIKMMLKCQVAQASSTCMLYYNLITRFYRIFCTFLLCAVAQSGGPWHNTHTLNTSQDVHVLMVTAY